MVRFGSFAIASTFAVLMAGLTGCAGSDAPGIPTGCPEENEIGGACAGVPQAAVCASGGACTSGVVCSSVIEVTDNATLTSAAASAASGACIALSPGSYGAVSIPG